MAAGRSSEVDIDAPDLADPPDLGRRLLAQ
jgi:hypothetical protein